LPAAAARHDRRQCLQVAFEHLVDVRLSHIVKRFGTVTANDDISVHFGPGRIHGLVGENGAGKSTLMRMLGGTLAPDSGRLTVDGRDFTRLTPGSAAACGIGLLPQDPLDFPPLTVWENFALGGGPVLGRRQARTRLEAACARLGFCLPPDTPVSRLTVAERQHLELARLFDRNARLLILDEPTTGISPTQRETLFAVLRDFVAGEGRLAVLVTHKLAEAKELCDTVSVLRQGRLVGRFDAPLDTQALLDAMFGTGARHDVAQPAPRTPGIPEKKAVTAPLVRLAGVTFADEKAVLEGLTCTLPPGAIIGLAGIAGGGQEIFLRGLAGLARTVAGRLTVSGRDLAGKPLARFREAGIRFLPAARLEEGLFPGLSPLDHLRLAFPDKRRAVSDLFASRCLDGFRLTNTPEAPARSLSGGNQQRLLLSLIPDDTRLLLAENPTRGLDAASIAQIWSHFRDRAAGGATVLFFSEDLDELMTHADRILVFYDRRIVADLPAVAGTPDDAHRLGDLMTGQAAREDLRP